MHEIHLTLAFALFGQRLLQVTFTCDGHTFNFLQDGEYTYLVVADEAYGRQIPFACLERVKDEFKSQYGDRARDAIAHALDRSFGPRIKAQMEYCANNPDELSKVSRVQAQVSEVKNIMMDLSLIHI